MIEREFQVDGEPDLEVKIESGRVELREAGPGSVLATVDTDDPDFDLSQRGNSIRAVTSRNPSWRSRHTYVVMTTPQRTDARVTVASATVEAVVALGRAEIATASGDVELAHAETLSVKTASGDLYAGSVARSLRFASASGDLVVRGEAGGTVSVSTASGDVDIAECDGTLDVKTASGNVRIGRLTARNASFRAMSGDVTLGVPAGTRLDLDANLLSGSLNLPQPSAAAPPERRVSVTVKLVSGDLSIERV